MFSTCTVNDNYLFSCKCYVYWILLSHTLFWTMLLFVSLIKGVKSYIKSSILPLETKYVFLLLNSSMMLLQCCCLTGRVGGKAGMGGGRGFTPLCVSCFPKPLQYFWAKSDIFVTLFMTRPKIGYLIYDPCGWHSCPKPVIVYCHPESERLSSERGENDCDLALVVVWI